MSHAAPPVEPVVALEQAPCGLMHTAADGTFLWVNHTFCVWLGRDADALVGRVRFQDLLSMGGRIFHQTHWAPLLQMQGSVSEVKLELTRGDGTAIPMVLNAIRQERQGVVTHQLAAFVARDRDQYERELVQSRVRLERAVAESVRLQAQANDRALLAEQMIGIVSHDLRNPLSAIRMGVTLLESEPLSSAQHEVLNRMSRSVDRSAKLITDLLDFAQARLGAGISVNVETIPGLHCVVAETIDELALIYPQRAIEHVRLGSGPCAADPHRLAQLLGNLVSNAMAYGSPDTPVVVTSSIDEDSISIAVHNDGEPILEASQAKMFEPLSRGTNAASVNRSIGLGLFIVSEIAKAHGGSAMVRSSAGEGTTLTVQLPRHGPTMRAVAVTNHSAE